MAERHRIINWGKPPRVIEPRTAKCRNVHPGSHKSRRVANSKRYFDLNSVYFDTRVNIDHVTIKLYFTMSSINIALSLYKRALFLLHPSRQSLSKRVDICGNIENLTFIPFHHHYHNGRHRLKRIIINILLRFIYFI